MKISLMLCTVTVLLWGVVAWGALPTTISYQGFLKDRSGRPVTAATSLTFRLYSSTRNGSGPLWTEAQSVTPVNGSYSVALGAVAPLASLPFDRQYFIGVTVAGTELTPRQPLTVAPYTIRAAVADKVGTVCADGETLTYSTKIGSWVCTAAGGILSSSTPVTGVLTVEGITPVTMTNPTSGPDPYKDVALYAIDLQLTNIHVLQGGSGRVELATLKVVCDPKKYGPALTQTVARGQRFPVISFWLPDYTGTYAPVIRLESAYLTGQKPVPPSRSGDPTLMEYTFFPDIIKFASHGTLTKYTSYSFKENKVSIGYGHAVPLLYGITHGQPFDLTALIGNTYYPAYSATSGIQRSSIVSGIVDLPTFSNVLVTAPLGNDFPALLGDVLSSNIIRELNIYTAAPEGEKSGAALLESRVKLLDAVLTGYRLVTGPAGLLQQELSYSYQKIYWGFYPYNPATGGTDSLVERGWDVLKNIAP